MDASVAAFSTRLQQPWLTCAPTQARIGTTFHQLVKILQTLPEPAFFVIATAQPEATLAAVLAALATQRAAVLGNPQWTPAETDNAVRTLGGCQLWLTDDATNVPAAQAGSVASVTASQVDGTNANADTAGAEATHTEPLPSPNDSHCPNALSLSPALRLQYRRHSTPPPLAPAELAGYLLVPTGGTGGRLKLAYHNWQTLRAAIDGYARFWQTDVLNCVCVLPVCHIGGLMPALRTFASGGRLCLLPWQKLLAQLENAPAPSPTALPAVAGNWQVSLVPTQVQRLLGNADAVRWLRDMQAVLIGGGSSSPELLKDAAALRVPLCPAYGMTEAAATIALQRPEDFFRDYQSACPPAVPCAEVLPHFSIRIEVETPGAIPASATSFANLYPPGSGRIILSGSSLFHGYFPQAPRSPQAYPTGDAGLLQSVASQPQRLCVLGRLDRIVISGGKKIDPALIEQRIAAAAQRLGIPLNGVLVTGVSDPRWGQRLIAFVALANAGATDVSAPSLPVPEALRSVVHQSLPAHQRPKQWFGLCQLPLDERGKPDRPRIQALAAAAPES